MELYQRLYDEQEHVKTRFVGFTTEDVRYDFGIVHTTMFFGKPLVICMQTGRSALLDSSDLHDLDHLCRAFKLKSLDEAKVLAMFFEEALPTSFESVQYE